MTLYQTHRVLFRDRKLPALDHILVLTLLLDIKIKLWRDIKFKKEELIFSTFYLVIFRPSIL